MALCNTLLIILLYELSFAYAKLCQPSHKTISTNNTRRDAFFFVIAHFNVHEATHSHCSGRYFYVCDYICDRKLIIGENRWNVERKLNFPTPKDVYFHMDGQTDIARENEAEKKRLWKSRWRHCEYLDSFYWHLGESHHNACMTRVCSTQREWWTKWVSGHGVTSWSFQSQWRKNNIFGPLTWKIQAF